MAIFVYSRTDVEGKLNQELTDFIDVDIVSSVQYANRQLVTIQSTTTDANTEENLNDILAQKQEHLQHYHSNGPSHVI